MLAKGLELYSTRATHAVRVTAPRSFHLTPCGNPKTKVESEPDVPTLKTGGDSMLCLAAIGYLCRERRRWATLRGYWL